MRWRIQPDSDQPIYEQIVDQVTYAVANDGLAAGVLVPSVRELAEKLLVNPNTVARAYQELERQGIVTARRGRGMEVTAEAPESCRRRRRDLAAQRLRHAVDEALGSGMPLDDVRGLVDHLLNNGHASRSSREAREKR
jgi:GntR family transcriptional regulator